MTAGPHPPAGQILTASEMAEHRLAAAGPGVDTARNPAHLTQQRAITRQPKGRATAQAPVPSRAATQRPNVQDRRFPC